VQQRTECQIADTPYRAGSRYVRTRQTRGSAWSALPIGQPRFFGSVSLPIWRGLDSRGRSPSPPGPGPCLCLIPSLARRLQSWRLGAGCSETLTCPEGNTAGAPEQRCAAVPIACSPNASSSLRPRERLTACCRFALVSTPQLRHGRSTLMARRAAPYSALASLRRSAQGAGAPCGGRAARRAGCGP